MKKSFEKFLKSFMGSFGRSIGCVFGIGLGMYGVGYMGYKMLDRNN